VGSFSAAFAKPLWPLVLQSDDLDFSLSTLLHVLQTTDFRTALLVIHIIPHFNIHDFNIGLGYLMYCVYHK